MNRNLYQTVRLMDGVTQIKNDVNDCMYLVEGREKAVLIDAGTGYGPLKEFVGTLTSLPLSVVITHGHMDHSGGSYEFDTVGAHPSDIPLMQSDHCSVQNRMDYTRMINPKLAATLTANDYPPLRKVAYLPLFEGDIIDLGGRRLEVIEVPGHTMGSIAFADWANGVAFTGDACSIRTFMMKSTNGGTVRQYLVTLQKYIRLMNRVEHMYWGHYDGVLTRDCVMQNLDCCIDIINGRDAHIPYEFMGEMGYTARPLKEDGLNRQDDLVGNIIYDEHVYTGLV